MRSYATFTPGAFPVGPTSDQIREVRRCLLRVCGSTNVPHRFMRVSCSRLRRRVNCIVEYGTPQVEFLLKSVTVVVNLEDIKPDIAKRISRNRLFICLPL